MIKKWIPIFLVVSSLALAVTSPFPVSKLSQIVEKPNSFKPDNFYDDSEINPGYKINRWEWNFDKESFGEGLTLSKTKNGKGWKFDPNYSKYKIDDLVKNKILLFILKDSDLKKNTSVYKVDFGKFKKVYLRLANYQDGSSSFDLQNREYVTYEGESSKFEKGGLSHFIQYNIYAYLFSKSDFCSLNDAFRSVKCKI